MGALATPGGLAEARFLCCGLVPRFSSVCSAAVLSAVAPQDLLVASLFRNFLLAERIMRSLDCSPVSLPKLPPTAQHAMWKAWDFAAEVCLAQVPELLQATRRTY